MNFSGHLVGGVLAGGAVVALAVITRNTFVEVDSVNQLFSRQAWLSGDTKALTALFLITCFMALFPDLDLPSIQQRWFYRVVLVVLVVLFFMGQGEVFALVAILVLLPVIHKHRGWTHWPITPFLIAIMMALIFEYQRSTKSWGGGFSVDNVFLYLKTYWMYVIGCVLGHYTHLLLDSKYFSNIFRLGK